MLATAANLRPVDTAAEHARVAYLIEQSVRAGAHPSASGATGIASNLIRAGELDEAERYVEAQLDVARAGGMLQLYGYVVQMRGWIALERGALADAEADLETAARAGRASSGSTRAWRAAMLALVQAEQGAAESAEAAAGRPGRRPAGHAGDEPRALLPRRAPQLALGRRDEALADALEVGRRYEQWGIRRAVPAWRSLAAVLLHGRSDADEARRLARGGARSWPSAGARRRRSGSPAARSASSAATSTSCARRSTRSRSRPPAWRRHAPGSTSARRCGAPAGGRTHAARSRRAWTPRTRAARGRWPSAPATSCARPARDRAASPCPAPRR